MVQLKLELVEGSVEVVCFEVTPFTSVRLVEVDEVTCFFDDWSDDNEDDTCTWPSGVDVDDPGDDSCPEPLDRGCDEGEESRSDEEVTAAETLEEKDDGSDEVEEIGVDGDDQGADPEIGDIGVFDSVEGVRESDVVGCEDNDEGDEVIEEPEDDEFARSE